VDKLSLEEAYNVLGLKMDCNEAELKKAYRSKAADFHPDKLSSKNLPDEFITFANDQLACINQAHEVICRARNFG
jgi:DnaJ like chaperone protein